MAGALIFGTHTHPVTVDTISDRLISFHLSPQIKEAALSPF